MTEAEERTILAAARVLREATARYRAAQQRRDALALQITDAGKEASDLFLALGAAQADLLDLVKPPEVPS